ncbi:MAG TPA: hypothetical protein VMW50_05885 [Dehalococcoidia bacterium]|nr:hypothetical protein [Dehalococcoidia bacterium]
MSAVKVSPAWKGSEYEESISGDSAVSVWQVEVGDPKRDTDQTALHAKGIPRKGSKQGALVAYSVVARREGVALFRVTARWAQLDEQAQLDLGKVDDPFSVPDQRSWDFETSVEPYDRDARGRAIVNSADEPLEPPPTMEFDDLVLTVSRNEPKYDPLLALKYARAVNSDNFYGFEPGCARVRITAELVRGERMDYWRTTYRVRFRSLHGATEFGGWELRLLDQGYRVQARDPDSGAWLTDEDGAPIYSPVTQEGSNMPVSAPILLNGMGRRLKKGKPAWWLHWQPRPALPFAKLAI